MIVAQFTALEVMRRGQILGTFWRESQQVLFMARMRAVREREKWGILQRSGPDNWRDEFTLAEMGNLWKSRFYMGESGVQLCPCEIWGAFSIPLEMSSRQCSYLSSGQSWTLVLWRSHKEVCLTLLSFLNVYSAPLLNIVDSSATLSKLTYDEPNFAIGEVI